MKRQEITIGRFLRIMLVLLVLGITYWALNSLSSVLLPFAVAWLLAYLLYPLVKFVQYRMRFKFRVLSIVVVMVAVCLALFSLFMLIVPSMVSELVLFKDIFLSFLSSNIKNPTIPPMIADYLRNVASDGGVVQLLQSSGVQDLAKELASQLQMILVGTVNAFGRLFGLFVTLLYMFFLLIDYEHLADEWIVYLPVRWRGVATKLSADLINGMNQYFRGQALVAFSVAVLYSIGFAIIDFPVAIGFGIFIGVLNLVPYLQLISLIPMLVLAMLKAANTGENFWLILIGALVVLAIVQVVQDAFLVPFFVGRRMNLHPALILLSLSVWGKLLGFLGLIMALPLTTLLLGYLKRYHELHGGDGDSGSSLAAIVSSDARANGTEPAKNEEKQDAE